MTRRYKIKGYLVSPKQLNLIVVIVGLLLFIGTSVLEIEWNGMPVWIITTNKLLSKVGEAFLVLGVMSFILGEFQRTDLKVNVSEVVGDVLETMREDVISDAYLDYTWDCYLLRPDANDPFPNDLVQLMRISYKVSNIPETVKLACVSCEDSSASSRLIDQLGVDGNCIFRYVVEPSMNPEEDNIFNVSDLLVNGHKIEPIKVDKINRCKVDGVKSSGGVPIKAKIYTFKICEEFISDCVSISFSVLVRKHFNDRLHIGPVLFKNTVRPKARIQIDPSLHVERINPNTLAVSPIGIPRPIEAGPTYGGLHRNLSSFVNVPFIVKAKSSIEFVIYFDRTCPMRDYSSELDVKEETVTYLR